MCDYPALAAAYHIVRTFKEMIFSKQVDNLGAWIESAKTLGSEDINGFLNGISRDIEAVKNAIIYDYNNGLAEGSINKIKLYKRIMYGRCSFETLRVKTLLLEKTGLSSNFGMIQKALDFYATILLRMGVR